MLHHGRGADEADLLPLADAFDPRRRLHVVTPRAPLTLDGWPGFHWYVVPRVGYPDPATFHASFAKLTAFHDEVWERTGIPPARTVLSGFSMGSVMSYATGLAPGRPRPAGLLIHAGFIPTVDGWALDLADRAGMPVRISHGVNDPVMSVEFGRQAAALLRAGGLDVAYEEHHGGHAFGPGDVDAGRAFLDAALPSPAGAGA